jgi:hypothetical protein
MYIVLTKELNRSIVDGPTTDIVCCMEKDKEKSVIAIIDTVIGTVDVLVAVTAAKYLVIDLFTGTVLTQQDFKGFYCTAADVIGNSSMTDFIPLIACGGYVNFRFAEEADDEKADSQPVKRGKVPYQVKIYDLMNGTFTKSIAWETSITSLSCFFSGKNQDPFVVTIGQHEGLLGKENRIVCWEVGTNRTNSSVFYDRITKENERFKRKIILSYESVPKGEEKYYKFYDKTMESAWLRGNFTTNDAILDKAYDYYLCRPTLVVINEGMIHRPTVYKLPSLSIVQNRDLPLVGNNPIETWTTFSSRDWYFGNDLSRKLVSLISNSTFEVEESSENDDEVENSLMVRHIIVQELGVDRTKPSQDFFVSFKKSVFQNHAFLRLGLDNADEKPRKCYHIQVAGVSSIEYIVMLFEDEFKAKSTILESSLLVVHNVKKKKSKTFNIAHKGRRILNVLPYKLLESVQKYPLVFLVFDSGIIRCVNSALEGVDEQVVKDPIKVVEHRVVDPLDYLTEFVGEVKDSKATKDSNWPKTLLRLYKKLANPGDQQYDEKEEDNEDDDEDSDKKKNEDPLAKVSYEDMEKFFNNEFWSRFEQIVYHAAEKKLDDFFAQMKPYAAPYCHNFNRALDIAIKNNSIRIVRLLLDYWLVVLNQEANDKDFVYDWFHRPSAFLPINSLISLVYSERKDFIKAFISFICAVQLIKSPKIMKADNEVLKFTGETMMILGSISYSESIDIWRSPSLSGISAPSTNFDACFIPIRNVGTLEMLSAFVRASDTLGDLSIFSSDVGKYATMFAWEKYGYRLHIWETFKYLIFMLLYSTAAFNFDSWIQQSDPYRYYAIWAIEAAVGLFLVYFIVNEINEIQYSTDVNIRATDSTSFSHIFKAAWRYTVDFVVKSYKEVGFTGICSTLTPQGMQKLVVSFKDSLNLVRATLLSVLLPNLEYFTEFWNVVDWTFIGAGLTGTVMRLVLQKDNSLSISFLAVGAIGTWFKLLYYFLPFENSGRLGKFEAIFISIVSC